MPSDRYAATSRPSLPTLAMAHGSSDPAVRVRFRSGWGEWEASRTNHAGVCAGDKTGTTPGRRSGASPCASGATFAELLALLFWFFPMALNFDSLRRCSGLIAAIVLRCSSTSTTKPPVLRTIALTRTYRWPVASGFVMRSSSRGYYTPHNGRRPSHRTKLPGRRRSPFLHVRRHLDWGSADAIR